MTLDFGCCMPWPGRESCASLTSLTPSVRSHKPYQTNFNGSSIVAFSAAVGMVSASATESLISA